MGWQYLGGLLGIIVVLAVLFYWTWEAAYADRVFPGVTIGALDLSGQPVDLAERQVLGLIKGLSKQTIIFTAEDFKTTHTLKELGVIFFDAITAEAVVKFGRQPGRPFNNFWQRLRAVVVGTQIPTSYQEQTIQTNRIMTKLRQAVDRAGIDGEVLIEGNLAKIRPAVTGQMLNTTELQNILRRRWRNLVWDPIVLPIKLAPPVFNDEVTQLTADKLNQDLAKGYVLTSRYREWTIPPAQLWQWVEVIKQDKALVVRLRPNDLAIYLQKLKTEVDQPVQEAVWKMLGSQVVEFQPDQPGTTLLLSATSTAIQAALLTEQHQIDLPAQYIEPKTTLAALNDLGIDQLVARGESNFTGSPKNRRHNIKTGAAQFNLVIIGPNETFSFNKILGVVDETTGYLPELVIKGDETTPEFGGGLCQVSTTAFRAALKGGYPIVARKNHSYRVSYYEPAGTDATVYQPYPDLKFLNDTNHSILIQTYVKENNLYFDFYSTKLNRRIELEGPKIFNITEPPETVYIETSTLPEGIEKRVDSAHRGADTILYRHIYDLVGREIRKDTFSSHYIPWPAKYLVGVPAAPKVETNLGNVPPPATAIEPPLPPANPL